MYGIFAVFLVWFLIGLFRRPDRFALGALLLVIGFLTTLNLINPDAFIVRQNIAHYWAGGDLDAPYLESLSADAVPALIKAATNGDLIQGNFPCQITMEGDYEEICGTELAQILQAGLEKRYLEMLDDSNPAPWQSTHLSHWCAQRTLSRIFPRPPISPNSSDRATSRP